MCGLWPRVRLRRQPGTYESTLRIDVFQRVLRLRVGPVLRKLHRRVDDLLNLAVDLRDLVVRELELRAQVVERILRLARLCELLLRAVHLRVADVVPDQAIRLGGEEHRSPTAARVLERTARGLENRLDVLPVDLYRLHAVCDRALRDVLDRHVLPA